MKKVFVILLVLVITPVLMAAKKINADTKIKWNSIVVVAALDDVGLVADYDTHVDVGLTNNRILKDLLKRKTFSVKEAVSVCMRECNKSSFLKNGKGQSGKKCPEICKNFGDKLVYHNNNKTNNVCYGESCSSGEEFYDGLGRIYSKDKKFYALIIDHFHRLHGVEIFEPLTKIFESSTNKAITSEAGMFCEGGGCSVYSPDLLITDHTYDGYEFELGCGHSLLHSFNTSNQCVLRYTSPETRCRAFYDNEFLPWITQLRETDFNGVKDLRKYSEVLNSFTNHWIEDALALKSVISEADKFTSGSLVPCDKAKDWYEKNRENSAKIMLKDDVNGILKDLKQLARYFRSEASTIYADNQVASPDRAIKKITDYVRSIFSIDINKLKCKAGECHKIGQDYVTCTLGPLQATFVFDDICDWGKKFSEWEDERFFD